MQKLRVSSNRGHSLAGRAPQAGNGNDERTSSRSTPTSAATRRRTSTRSGDETDETTTRRSRKSSTRSRNGPTSSATTSDALLAGIASGTIQSYDSSVYAPGGSASVALAAATATSNLSSDLAAPAAGSGGGDGLPKPALYAIIGGGALVAAIAIFCLISFWLKRRKDKRRETENQWMTYSPNPGFTPGKGQGARGERLPDDDSGLHGVPTLEKNAYVMEYASSPWDEKKGYNFDHHGHEPSTPTADQYQNIHSEDINLTPSHPDYVPVRPPRPSQQFSFTSSPIRPQQHQLPSQPQQAYMPDSQTNSQHHRQSGMNTYQRNLLALTTSMSFENNQLANYDIQDMPQSSQEPSQSSSPFDDANAIPAQIQRKPSRKVDHKKDTIIGFAESYGDDEEDFQNARDAVRPLSFKSGPSPTKTNFSAGDTNDYPLQRSLSKRSKTSDVAPKLSALDLGLPTSTSSTMRDLENVLDSFGYRDAAAQVSAERGAKSGPTLANRAPNRGLVQQSFTTEEAEVLHRDGLLIDEDGGNGTGAKSSYRITRPGAAVGLALVPNINSIHSTAGDIGEIASSPVASRFPASSTSVTSANLAALTISDTNTGKGISKSTTSPALAANKRRSVIASQKCGESRRNSVAPEAGQRSLPALVRTDSRNSTGEVLLSSSYSTRRMSVMTTDTGIDHESSPFGLEEDANLARAVSMSRKSKQRQSVDGKDGVRSRQRSHSVGVRKSSTTDPSASGGGVRQARSRTSTAYGGQMPSTPALGSSAGGNGRSRTMTTESEAVFAVGSNMLSASPNSPQEYTFSTPTLSMPRIQAMSHFQREQEQQRRMAEDGFVPLAQMGLSSNGHDQHYRSPIDSIVGTFEYDEGGHHATLSNDFAKSRH